MRIGAPKGSGRSLNGEDGFTLIFAIMIMFVASLLVAGVFVAADGDIKLTSATTNQSKAYYAAVAGISRYKYKLNSEPNSWEECPTLSNTVAKSSEESYIVKTLPSSKWEKEGHTTCQPGKQISIVESSGSADGTFRIESTGESGGAKRSIVATLTHPGFLNYVYFTKYEVEDPTNFTKPVPTAECEHYYSYRKETYYEQEGKNKLLTSWCQPIEFASADKINGPLHTDDSADICAEGSSKPTFGRNKTDKIEINGGTYSAGGTCSDSYTMNGTYTEKGEELSPPATDSELLESVESEYKFQGRTTIELKTGTPNTIAVTNSSGVTEPTKNFPKNGVIYVENSSAGCGVTYTPFNSNYTGDTGCGNVYVKGSYTESLTIAAANDVIVDGNIETTHISSGEPTGTATLGLIATNFVRIYHPVEEKYEVENYAAKTETPMTRTGTVKSGKKEVTSVVPATTGLNNGEEVIGTGIASGTTIKELKPTTEIILSKTATGGTTGETLSFCKSGYKYYSAKQLCVKEPQPGYTYHEAENWDSESCNSAKDTYIEGSKGFCEYENTSEGCDAPNATGSLENPVVDAAILSTDHSFIVDNYSCGKHLGNLNVWGSIAQFWRGPVGTGGGSSSTGYTKDYNYDERLATDQPPNFLSPSTTEWKVSRETAPPNGFTG
jgi:hypothetical protein